MGRKTIATLCVGVLCLAVTLPLAFAGTRTHSAVAAASCRVSDSTVAATNLPTDALVNFFVTNAAGKTGWVLGYTSDGTWSVDVPARAGSTKYEFASTTFGKNGSKYWVYASCSADS